MMEFQGYNGNILKYDGTTITVPNNNSVSSWTFNISKNDIEEEKEIRGGKGNMAYSTIRFSKGTQEKFDQIKDKSNIHKVDCYLNDSNGTVYFVIPTSDISTLVEKETQEEMNPFLQEYI